MLRARSDIAQCRPATERSRDRKIRNQQQRPDHRQQPALLARGGVNTAAIREMTADNDVIDADQPGERTNGQDDRQRRKPGGDKRQTNDVRLARAPIAVEQRRQRVSNPDCAVGARPHSRREQHPQSAAPLLSGGESPLRARLSGKLFSVKAAPND